MYYTHAVKQHTLIAVAKVLLSWQITLTIQGSIQLLDRKSRTLNC